MKNQIIRYTHFTCLLLSLGWVFWARDWESAINTVTLLISFILLHRKFDEYPDLSGKWEYEVVTQNQQFSHKGIGTIEQKGRFLKMRGVRKYTFDCSNPKITWKEVNSPWESDWAEICDDGSLRLEYHIITNDKKGRGVVLKAVAKMAFESVKVPTEIQGNYFTLPPFDENTLNCLCGLLIYKKVPKGHKLAPPDELASRLRNPATGDQTGTDELQNGA